MIAAFIVATMALPTGGAPAAEVASCATLASSLMRVLEMAQFEKEPEGSIRRVFRDATEAETRCEANESLTYLRLRSAELGKGSTIGEHLTPAARTSWRQLADAAVARFPHSARILTVAARATGSVDIAKRAVAADQAYVPAKVALATALVTAGDAVTAAKVLDGLPGLDATSDGFTVLARARLASHDSLGAASAAKQELTRRQAEIVERDVRNPWPIIEAHEVAGFAALALHRYDDAARHLVAADFGSAQVREILADPPPPLRRALKKIRPRRVPSERSNPP